MKLAIIQLQQQIFLFSFLAIYILFCVDNSSIQLGSIETLQAQNITQDKTAKLMYNVLISPKFILTTCTISIPLTLTIPIFISKSYIYSFFPHLFTSLNHTILLDFQALILHLHIFESVVLFKFIIPTHCPSMIHSF